MPSFLWTSLHAPFPLGVDFALCSFAVLNHSNECNYMLSPGHPSEPSSQMVTGLKPGDTLNKIGIMKDE